MHSHASRFNTIFDKSWRVEEPSWIPRDFIFLLSVLVKILSLVSLLWCQYSFELFLTDFRGPVIRLESKPLGGITTPEPEPESSASFSQISARRLSPHQTPAPPSCLLGWPTFMPQVFSANYIYAVYQTSYI